jgi:type IV pilus assembly protein PilB
VAAELKLAMQTNGFGNYLVKNDILGDFVVREAQNKAHEVNSSLVTYVIEKKLLSYAKIAEHTAKYFGLPQANLQNYDVDNAGLIDKKLIEKYQILPLEKQDRQLYVAVSDPTQTQVLNEIKFYTNCNIRPLIAEYDKLRNLIASVLYVHRYDDFYAEDAHIIKLVDQILHEAIEKGASDIHFEPYETNYRIRFRIDGMLHEITNPDFSLVNRLTARLKIMSNLDISERRLPQDGRFSVSSRDCRINTCPTLFGEKIVVRILNVNNELLEIDEIGLEKQQQKIFLDAINRPQGMILVTGPTGSGKTVSLYAALNELNSINKNISTVEDPIEINLNGINQVQVNNKIGLDFTTTLRAFLRQDPDIIMVGEIRDLETADIAIKAAQTGHLVLSTLHTNNANETITRLLNMGIAQFNINSSLSLIIAQRLVRKLCPHCKRENKIAHNILLEQGFLESELDNLIIYTGNGCEHCYKGYRGRIGIFEVMPITEDSANISGLREAALNKVRQGLTSLEEINRVI